MVGVRRPTLRDVAERAGVSRTTASYALAGRSVEMRISAETAGRVVAAATELGFRPDRTAQSLRTRRTRTIGLISDYVAYGEFAGRMLAGASAASRARDHLVVIGESEGDPELERRIIEELLERGVDALIYATLACRQITAPETLQNVPSVLLNCFDPDAALPAVIPDDEAGGRSAARIVLAAGTAERTLIVGTEHDGITVAGERRIAGIRAEFAAASIGVFGHLDCAWDVADAYRAVSLALREPVAPTALICLNDRVAMGAYEALEAVGLHPRRDIAVVAFDGSNLARWLRPPVTSVAIPFDELGAIAVSLLLEPRTEAQVVEVPMPIAEGASV